MIHTSSVILTTVGPTPIYQSLPQESHQCPQSHVSHPIRYDCVLPQNYTNSDPRLMSPITPIGQSHLVPTGARTPHFVHGYNDTHRYTYILQCSSHSVVGKRARLGNFERAG